MANKAFLTWMQSVDPFVKELGKRFHPGPAEWGKKMASIHSIMIASFQFQHTGRGGHIDYLGSSKE